MSCSATCRPARPAPSWSGCWLPAAAGLVAIWGLLGYVRSHTYTVFVVFRLVMAAFILLLIAANVREATF